MDIEVNVSAQFAWSIQFSPDVVPKFLHCGHRVCVRCASNMHNAAFGWISCQLCRNITEIELPNNLNSDVEFLRLVAERRSLKEIIVRKDETCNNQLLQIADLQQQVDLCREMHGERDRMSSPASSVTFPLENAASSVIVEPQPSTSGTTNESKRSRTPSLSSDSDLQKKKSRKLKKNKGRRHDRDRPTPYSTSSSDGSESSEDGPSSHRRKRKQRRSSHSKSTNVGDELRKKFSFGKMKVKQEPKDNQDLTIKDLFLCSLKDVLEMPNPTENKRLKENGLGYQYDVRFPVVATSADVRAIFAREFPRLREVQAYYVCSKGPGTSNRLAIKNYSIPSGQEIRRMSGKLIALVPIGESLECEAASSEEEGVVCKTCKNFAPIRRYGQHKENCPTENRSRRKTN